MSKKTVELTETQKGFIGNIRRFTVSHEELNTEGLLRTILEFEKSLSNSPGAKSQPKAHRKLYKPFKTAILYAAATIDAYVLSTKLLIEQSGDLQTIHWKHWNEMQKGSFYEIFKCAHKAKILLLAITECLQSRDENMLLDLLAQTYALGLNVQRFKTLELELAAQMKYEALKDNADGGNKKRILWPADLILLQEWEVQLAKPGILRKVIYAELARKWAERYPDRPVKEGTIKASLLKAAKEAALGAACLSDYMGASLDGVS